MGVARIVFCGMEGGFSPAPLLALRRAGFELCGVLVPRPSGVSGPVGPRPLSPPARSPLAVQGPRAELSALGLAWSWGVPAWEIGGFDAGVVELLRSLRPDLLCVACFPYLLPTAVRRSARLGALNVHPALLPAYRGPAPLFWVFHDGLEQAGVTVHLIDGGVDSGDIVRQAPVALPDGIGYGEAERALARAGGALLVEAVRDLVDGRAAPWPQPDTVAPRAPTPGAQDFVITPAWSARRAFDFLRGLREWARPIVLEYGGERFIVRDALGYVEDASPAVAVERAGDTVRCAMSCGILTVARGEPFAAP